MELRSSAIQIAKLSSAMTYIISDIHGRADRFHNILEQIQFSKSDTLYVLGDVIDRNLDGIAILQEIMITENILMILGNHEYMMLNVVRLPAKKMDQIWLEDLGLWYLNGGEVTYLTFQKLSEDEQKKIIDYLDDLPLNREIRVEGKDYLLIHGSPVSTFEEEYSDFSNVTMHAVWNRFDPFEKNAFAGKTVICGHTPTVYFTHRTPMEVFQNDNTICMDCGCAFPDGRLGCLCLETGKIIYSVDE